MGVSSRATHAIEPRAGDLLMPERIRRASATRMRDVEDACFETVGDPRDVFSTRPSATDSGGVFKSRLTQSAAHGSFPRDYPHSDFGSRISTEQGERLGVFNAAGKPRVSVAAPAFVMTLCAAIAAAFWFAGGHALVLQPDARMQASAASAPEMSIKSKATLLPDPVVTSSIPEKKTGSAKDGYTAPVPRPARIERAGSILMIRPGGG